MSNLIESMINENVQFSESEKVKKTTDKKVVKEGKVRKRVKESVDGTDEIYVIVSGGMIEDVFTTDSNLDVSVIDLDVEYDENLYQDVLDRYERNELKNAYVYYQYESLKGKKKKDRR